MTPAARRASIALALLSLACASSEKPHASTSPVAEPAGTIPPWEQANPVKSLPVPPLGVAGELSDLEFRVTPEKVRLGRWLFYDTRLSKDGAVSCSSCHEPERGFSEAEPVSTGVHGKKGTRKAPPILNVAFPVYPVFFWDGRASTLAEQAKGPMSNPVEMGMAADDVVAAVRAVRAYGRYFAEAYGDERVDLDRIAEAIAAYEATRLSGNSAYDRWDAGDPSALTHEERMGREIFFGKAACSQCHLGFNFSDARFHNLGVGWNDPGPGSDPHGGFRDRGRATVTGKDEDTGAFKTPTLRDVSKRSPYMHDGSVATLREAVELYDRGGVKNPWLSVEVKPLHLTRNEIDALVAFLKALDGEGYLDAAPEAFPR